MRREIEPVGRQSATRRTGQRLPEALKRTVEVRVAATFLSRLRGLIGRPPLTSWQGLWIEPCCAIHTFGMTHPIDVAFVDADGCVLAVHEQLPPRRLRVCWGGRGALELAAGFASEAGIVPGSSLNWEGHDRHGSRVCVVAARRSPLAALPGPASRSRMAGTSTVEWLIAAPLVLLLGLGTLQWGLLFNARQTLDYALQQASRAGAVSAASAAAIERGLAHGMLPYFGGAAAGQPVSVSLPAALARVQIGKAAGWLDWRQLSPTRASFDDWGEPGRDARGDPVAGAIEIPNDNLRYRSRAIGTSSRQTLADANLLKLELTVGVPLAVPLVAPLAVWWMEIIDHCRPAAPRMLGAVPLPAGSVGLHQAGAEIGQSWRCPYYRARDDRGRASLRWPVRLYALVRMQSPARLWPHTPFGGAGIASDAGSSEAVASDGKAGAISPGNYSTAPTLPTLLDSWADQSLPGVARLNPNGYAPAGDGSAARSSEFPQIGSDRLAPEPVSSGPSAG